jgi:hypothetical protein
MRYGKWRKIHKKCEISKRWIPTGYYKINQTHIWGAGGKTFKNSIRNTKRNSYSARTELACVPIRVLNIPNYRLPPEK